MNIGEMKEQIYIFTDLGGFLGENLSIEKEVLLEVDGKRVPLIQVAATFTEGRFVLLLQGGSCYRSAMGPMIHGPGCEHAP